MAGRRDKNRKRHRGGPETPEQMIDRVIGAFIRWQDDHPSKDLPRHEILYQVIVLIKTKALVGDPNPAEWSALAVTELFEYLKDQPQIVPIDDIANRSVPALSVYFDFLTTTGRWKQHNDEQAGRAELERLRRSVQSGRDPGATVTELPPQWADRFAGPDLDDVDNPFDNPFDEPFDDPVEDFEDFEDDDDEVDPIPESALAAAVAEFTAAAQVPPGTSVAVTVPAAEREWTALSDSALFRQLRAFAQWVGPGRPISRDLVPTGSDYQWWVDHHELSIADDEYRQVTEVIALLNGWEVAVEAGVVTVDGDRAARGPRAHLLDAPASTAAVGFGRDLVEHLMDVAVAPGAFPDPEEGAEYAATLPLLVSLCADGGQDLDALPGESDRLDEWETDEERALDAVRDRVLDNLRMLAAFGLIPSTRGRVSVPEDLRPAVVQAIDAPGAPFEIRLAADAVRLADPEA